MATLAGILGQRGGGKRINMQEFAGFGAPPRRVSAIDQFAAPPSEWSKLTAAQRQEMGKPTNTPWGPTTAPKQSQRDLRRINREDWGNQPGYGGSSFDSDFRAGRPQTVGAPPMGPPPTTSPSPSVAPTPKVQGATQPPAPGATAGGFSGGGGGTRAIRGPTGVGSQYRMGQGGGSAGGTRWTYGLPT